MKGLAVVDDFFPDVNRVRQHALLSEFIDWVGPDGETYKRICISPVPTLIDALVSRVGDVNILGMGYRLNYEDEAPNQAIHSDIGWGTHALVVYLNDGPSGTAFWKHKESGTVRIREGQTALFEKVKNDWKDSSKWELREEVPMKMNRAAIYESELYHSRYPFKAFGNTPETGRLIVVAFFNMR
jgi:hypothetical protein